MKRKNGLNIIRSKDVTTKKGKWGTKLKIICDRKTPTNSLMVGIAILEKDVETEEHYHGIEELQYIIEGEAIVHDYSGKEFFVTKGDFVYCPNGVEGAHAFKNIGREPLIILFIYPSDKGKHPKVTIHDKNKV